MNSKRGIILLLIFILIIFTCLISSLLIFYLFYNQKKNGFTDGSTLKTFQITEISLSNPNVTKYGLTTLPITQFSSIEDFVTFTPPKSSSSFIISHLNGEEYECTGSCFCDHSNRRSTSSSLLTRGLTILISAFSVSMATKVASDIFRDQCFQMAKDSGTCDVKDVNYEIEKCGEKVEFQYGESFLCKGHCLKNPEGFGFSVRSVPDLVATHPKLKKMDRFSKDFVIGSFEEFDSVAPGELGDCETRRIERVIDPVAISKIYSSEKMLKKYLAGKKAKRSQKFNYPDSLVDKTTKMKLGEVKSAFILDVLKPFCEESTKLSWLVKDIYSGEEIGSEQEEELMKLILSLSRRIDSSYCLSDTDKSDKEGFPNVECVRNIS